MKRVLICSAILLCLISLAYGGKKCAVCGKQVTSRYTTYSYDYVVCDKCERTASRCETCNKPSARLISTGGRHVCRDCKSGSFKCKVCGKNLNNEFTHIYSPYMVVCQACAKLDRCSQCGIPSRRLTEVGYSNLCPKCLGETNSCTDCGKPLAGNSYQVREKPSGSFCEKCYLKYQPCSVCGQRAGSGYHRDKNRRVVCRNCWSTSQPSLVTAKEVSRQVAGHLYSAMNIHLRRPVEFSTKRSDGFGYYSGGGLDNLHFNVDNETGKINISISKEASKQELYWAIGYSYGSAWYWENCGINVYDNLGDAFSEWVGYKTLMNFGLGDIWDRVYNNHVMYSAAFKKLQELEKTGGAKAVINYVKSASKEPSYSKKPAPSQSQGAKEKQRDNKSF